MSAMEVQSIAKEEERDTYLRHARRACRVIRRAGNLAFEQAVNYCDMLMVVNTSGVVYPAAGLVAQAAISKFMLDQFN